MRDRVNDASFEGGKTQDIELGVEGNLVGTVAVDPPRVSPVGLGIAPMNQSDGNLSVSITGGHPHAFFREIRRIPVGNLSDLEDPRLPSSQIEFFNGRRGQDALVSHSNKAVFKSPRTEGIEATDRAFLVEFFPERPQITAIRGRNRLSVDNFEGARAPIVARLGERVTPVGQREEIAIGLEIAQALPISGGVERYPAVGVHDRISGALLRQRNTRQASFARKCCVDDKQVVACGLNIDLDIIAFSNNRPRRNTGSVRIPQPCAATGC